MKVNYHRYKEPAVWGFRIGSAILGLLALTHTLPAQDVLAPPPQEFSQPPVPRAWQANQFEMLAPPPPSGNQPPLRWGSAQFRPHVFYRLSYGNGIQSQPGKQENTLINEFAPGMFFQLGDHWTLDYTPTLRFYSTTNFQDTWDNSIFLSGGTTYEDWSLSLSQSYISSSQPLIETASQTDTETFATALGAVYHMSSAMSLELGLNQNLRFVSGNSSSQQLTDSKDWSTMEWLNYQFWPKFGAAIGVGGGYNKVSAGSDMTYWQLQGRINWLAGDKLSFMLNGGFEDRQFMASGAPDLINPLFGMTLLYKLFEQTTLSMTGDSTVSASLYQSQVTESTGISASLSQRLLGKLTLGLSGGYRVTSYKYTYFGFGLNRKDNYSFFNARLTCPFLKRATASVFYNWSDNNSDQSGFQYASTQIGLELGYRY